jgi:hypothetical protein
VKKVVLKSEKVGEAPVVERKTIASEYEGDDVDEDLDGGEDGEGGNGGTSDDGGEVIGGGTVILDGDGSPQLNLL